VKRLHLVIGLIGIVAFLGTGVSMRLRQPNMLELDGGARMLYRSRHIYLLLSGLLNVALGTYYGSSGRTWRRRFQSIGSCLILTAPPLLLAAFVVEPHRSGLSLPFTRPAIIGVLVGTLLHSVGGADSDHRQE
jgi:hypothetical protein